MRWFDELYRVGDGEDAGPAFFNRRFRSLDERVHTLEDDRVSYLDELGRIRTITIEQATVLLQDAAALVEGMAQLATIVSVTSPTQRAIGPGLVTFTVPQAERAAVPQVAYVVAVPRADRDTRMGGFMTGFNAETGALEFDATDVAGDGTFGDWIIGLAGTAGAGTGASTAGDIVFVPAGTLEADTVQGAVEELDDDLTLVAGRVTTLEDSGGAAQALAFATYQGV